MNFKTLSYRCFLLIQLESSNTWHKWHALKYWSESFISFYHDLIICRYWCDLSNSEQYTCVAGCVIFSRIKVWYGMNEYVATWLRISQATSHNNSTLQTKQQTSALIHLILPQHLDNFPFSTPSLDDEGFATISSFLAPLPQGGSWVSRFGICYRTCQKWVAPRANILSWYLLSPKVFLLIHSSPNCDVSLSLSLSCRFLH